MHLLQIEEPKKEKNLEKNALALGIDLGTTHSVVALSRGKFPEVLSVQGDVLVPSCVRYGEETLVGQEACDPLKTGELVRSSKRILAENPAEVLVPQKGTTPVQVAKDILEYLRKQVEQTLDQRMNGAVITVPAYFPETARAATRKAAESAGIKVLRLLNEPTAAAVAYQLDEGNEGYYLVYDLGGGTFDISLLYLEKGIFQVIAVGGDTSLGGDDFDRAVQKALAEKYPHNSFSKEAAKKIKEYLTDHPQWESGCRSFYFSMQELTACCADLIDQTLQIAKKTLCAQGVCFTALEDVVLVGGMTRMPAVQEKVKDFFGKQPLCRLNPEHVVALGAALQADYLIHGTGKLLIDVVPLSLGIETIGGGVEVLIPRNTALPFAVHQDFTTAQDNQAGLVIHVVQGEAEHVEGNRSLARFSLRELPQMPAGKPRIRVTFSLDSDGVLHVSAKELSTGVEQKIDVKPSYGLTEHEVLKRLKAR